MNKIRLEFRRGGDWRMERDSFYIMRPIHPRTQYRLQIAKVDAKCDGTLEDHEYAGPFELEIVEPEPELLRIEGFSEPECGTPLTDSLWSVTAYSLTSEFLSNFPIRILGNTRREAIERYNALARMMGAH